MAVSTCIKCEGTEFEVAESQPKNSRFKLLFVQCSSCGGVVGALEHTNVSALLHLISTKLKIKLD